MTQEHDEAMAELLGRDLKVLGGQPVDLDAARAQFRSRLAQVPAEPLRAPRRRNSRRLKVIAAGVVVALGLGGGVAVANRYVVQTDDGTRLEQLFEGTTQDSTWTVDVTVSPLDGSNCVTVKNGAGSGGICGNKWDEPKPNYPSSTATPIKGSAKVDGQPQWLLVIVAPADRTVAIASNWSDGSRSTDLVSDLPGVQESPATLQGVQYKVYAVMVPESYANPDVGENHISYLQ